MTTKTHNIIKINGKSYDAITGKLIEHGAVVQSALSIDGVVTKSVQHTHVNPIEPSHSARKAAVTSKVHRVHTVAPAAKLQKVHPSKTIMRHAVKKPSAALHTQLSVQTPTDLVAIDPNLALATKLSVHGVDKRREARAKRINKSKLVSRFGSWDFTAPTTLAVPANVSPAPAVQVNATTHHPVNHATKQAQHTPRRSMDIFEKALQQATSHELQPAPAKTRAHATRKHRVRSHRLANVTAAALAVVFVGGLLAYQNVANVTLHMASGKAGFAASLPSYHPSGFSVGRFAYSPGNVTIHFHSNSDSSRSFAIAEKPSNWDSATLLNDYVASAGQNYQTVQTAGRTIYLYGDKKATWVNNGVWYNVDNDGSLSTNQLVSLASSM